MADKERKERREAPSPASDRRRRERRISERVQPLGRSWFGVLDGLPEEEEAGADAHSIWSDGLSPEPDSEPAKAEADAVDSRPSQGAHFFSREARRLVGTGQTAFQRIYRAFLGARAALAVVLVVSLVLTGVLSTKPGWAVTGITLAYAVQALSLWLLPRAGQRLVAKGEGLARLRGREWLLTIGIDVACYLSLHLLTTNTLFNHVPLLVLPVLMAGVLTPRVIALGTASVVAIGLLAVAWRVSLSGVDPSLVLTQAGLAGSGFFVITVLAGELAGRIAREERSARGSLELARQQAQLNRLMIEEMQDGVLVVDRMGRVRAANPAARRLLAPAGLCPPAPFNLGATPAWNSVVRSVEQAFAGGTWPEEGRDVEVRFSDNPPNRRMLRMRVRFTRHHAAQASEDFCVLLLEDVRSMQARTRQEKLAAMGRMSAGIAHEIRNPLAAIAQANALMAEDAATPGQRQLTRMVTENVERLKRIIDDVLEAAPAGRQRAGVVDVCTVVGGTCSEWARAAGLPLGGDSPLQVELPRAAWGAAFDADHLRRVLVNLLDNALRHGTRAPGSVRLRLRSPVPNRLELLVASDGEPIAADVEPYLFEPFFSTRSRGTGLGLYICRELCERYGASIDYRLCPKDQVHRNEFVVVMPQQPLPLDNADASLPLPT
jgi:two-component system sensor histidine kinase PilS (NtrC family)